MKPSSDNPTIRSLIKEKHFVHRGKSYPLTHSTPTIVCERYHSLIVGRGYSRILEIGTLYGFSTLFLADAASRTNGTVTTVDLRLEKRMWANSTEIINVHEVAEKLVAQAGFTDIVRFLTGDSNSAIATLYETGEKFDFILIDGSHNYPVALIDFIYADAILETAGVIALDDIGARIAQKPGLNGGPNRLLPMIFSSGRYDIEPVNANVCLAKKRSS